VSCRDRDEPLLLLEEWFDTTLGRELVVREEECLRRMLSDIFGYYLLQVGMTAGFAGAIAASRIRNRILLPVDLRRDTLGSQIVASPGYLPVSGDSVDAVLLPHTLDFAADARQVLREVERVLIPEGRVVLIGFNALSLWGLWGLMRRNQGRVPWCGHFLTRFRVADWLSLLGFDVEKQEMMMFRPPWPRALLQRLSFLEPAGSRFWPPLGGVYAIRAVKRVSTLTPLRPSWKSRRPVLAGAVGPTVRREQGRPRPDTDGPGEAAARTAACVGGPEGSGSGGR
jgi:SAM-dependent methyltransferase